MYTDGLTRHRVDVRPDSYPMPALVEVVTPPFEPFFVSSLAEITVALCGLIGVSVSPTVNVKSSRETTSSSSFSGYTATYTTRQQRFTSAANSFDTSLRVSSSAPMLTPLYSACAWYLSAERRGAVPRPLIQESSVS